MKSLKRCWRLIATAMSFALFGLGGIIIPLIVIPIIYLLPGDAQRRQRRGKAFIHQSFRLYIQLMKNMGVLSYELEDVDRLKQAKLVLANHPTLIDVVFLISLIPQANCVVKSALMRNPFTRGPLKAAGYIVNNESVDDVIAAAEAAFENGDTLIIFPEGTRSVPGEVLELKRGAANVAVRTQVDVTPVLIDCQPVTLTKGQPWYRIPDTKPHFKISVAESIAITNFIKQDKPSVAARNLTSALSQYFNEEIGLRERTA